MRINNTPITNSNEFLHKYFWGRESCPADEIDANVDSFVVSVCLGTYIEKRNDSNGNKVYFITEAGKKILGY